MFTSYYRLGPNTYQELFGLGFDQLAPGQRFVHRPGVTLSQQDNVEEALDSVNAAMVHYDEPYAQQTAFKRPLMVSTITLQRLVGMASKTVGLARRRIRTIHEIALRKPVFGGDTLYAESEVLQTDADAVGGTVRMLTRGINQRGEEVAVLDYSFEMWNLQCVPAIAALEGGPVLEPRFASHAQRPDSAWVEQTGLFYEDLQPGETFHHYPARSVRRDEAVTHALRSLEIAPAHHAGDTARVTEPWTLAIAAALSTRTFGRVTANLAWRDVQFLEEVRPGDTLQARSQIVGKRESSSRPAEGIVTVVTQALNQVGKPVLNYERTLLVYKRGAETPYAAAGY